MLINDPAVVCVEFGDRPVGGELDLEVSLLQHLHREGASTGDCLHDVQDECEVRLSRKQYEGVFFGLRIVNVPGLEEFGSERTGHSVVGSDLWDRRGNSERGLS